MGYLLVDLLLFIMILALLYVVNQLCDHVNKTDALLRERGIKR
mgnify:CR=1 FL=1